MMRTVYAFETVWSCQVGHVHEKDYHLPTPNLQPTAFADNAYIIFLNNLLGKHILMEFCIHKSSSTHLLSAKDLTNRVQVIQYVTVGAWSQGNAGKNELPVMGEFQLKTCTQMIDNRTINLPPCLPLIIYWVSLYRIKEIEHVAKKVSRVPLPCILSYFDEIKIFGTTPNHYLTFFPFLVNDGTRGSDELLVFNVEIWLCCIHIQLQAIFLRYFPSGNGSYRNSVLYSGFCSLPFCFFSSDNFQYNPWFRHHRRYQFFMEITLR